VQDPLPQRKGTATEGYLARTPSSSLGVSGSATLSGRAADLTVTLGPGRVASARAFGSPLGRRRPRLCGNRGTQPCRHGTREPTTEDAELIAAPPTARVTPGIEPEGKDDEDDDEPVKTITQPSRTVTYSMPSSSMEPTLHCAKPSVGCEATYADKMVVKEPAEGISRSDVIVFHTPPQAAVRCGSGGLFVKRVIGLPGESVSERNGFIYIDGKRLNEPYIEADRRDHEPARAWHVPACSYFVLGDNRAQSCDSRAWVAVPSENIVGKVVQILRPG